MAKDYTEHHIAVQKSARVYVAEPDGAFHHTIVAVHGYGQLGKYFIRHFEPLTALGLRVIVPEGLHRFYLEGTSGRVGASWMTKEDRLTDIADYVDYLSQVSKAFHIPDNPWTLLGFSQGGPTACRWLAAMDGIPEALVLHSTVFPNDFDFEGQRSRFERIPTYVVFGDQDPYAPEHIIEEKLEWMRSKGIRPNLLRFQGGHTIHQETVASLLGNHVAK